MSSSLMAQQRHDARWIDGLKKTPVDQLGSGLPHKNFAEWFADLVKPNETGYEVQQCQIHNPADDTTEQLFCVVAYTKPPQPGWRRWIELSFTVGSIPQREERANGTGANRVSYIFLRGIESPVNPKMARPDRIISTLSDLESMVHGSASNFLKSRSAKRRGIPMARMIFKSSKPA
jgi:hypothetical protein